MKKGLAARCAWIMDQTGHHRVPSWTFLFFRRSDTFEQTIFSIVRLQVFFFFSFFLLFVDFISFFSSRGGYNLTVRRLTRGFVKAASMDFEKLWWKIIPLEILDARLFLCAALSSSWWNFPAREFGEPWCHLSVVHLILLYMLCWTLLSADVTRF